MGRLVSDIKLYAKLLNSVGQQGSGGGRRPLSPVECARYMQQILDEEGDSLEQLSKRLNLGKPKDTSNIYKKRDTSQATTFLNLLKVSERSRDLAGWQTSDHPQIPFSTIAQLHTMSEDDQDAIVQTILKSTGRKRVLGKEDVKKIKQWRRDNPDISIHEGIERVLKLKPITIIRHIVVAEIRERLRRFIDSHVDYKERLLVILRDSIDGEFSSIDAGDSVVAISMDEEAFKRFHESQHGKGISYTLFLDKLLEDKIE